MFRHLAIALLVSIAAQIAPLEAASEPEQTVERVRGLKFDRPVIRKSIARSDLRVFLQKQLDADLPYSPEEYIDILRALHLLDEVEDPMGRLFSLYEAQALAFYDPRTHTYYSMDAPPGEDGSSVPEDAVEIHELAHALQDQRFGIGAKLEAVRLNWDAAMAYQALLEGEATLVMMASLYEGFGLDFDSIVRDDSFLTLLTAASTHTVGIPEGTPLYFVESMSFPYIDGLRFVIHAYRTGGWKAVDRLHENPPRSTLEIMNPAIYGSADGRSQIEQGTAGSGEAGPLLVTTLGVFHWKFLLGEQAASGWKSDRVEVRKGPDGGLTVLGEAGWKTSADAAEFVAALREKWKAEGVIGKVSVNGAVVRFGYGPDGNAVERFLGPAPATVPAPRARRPSSGGKRPRNPPPEEQIGPAPPLASLLLE